MPVNDKPESHGTARPLRERRKNPPERRQSIVHTETPADRDREYPASWEEQRTQCMTRYLFWALGLAYFNLGERSTSEWVDLATVNVVLAVYAVMITVTLMHAWHVKQSSLRRRLSMLLDLLVASFAVVADPVAYSPGYLVYAIIVFGNGMRYGQRVFAEAAALSFVAAAAVTYLRFSGYEGQLDLSLAFFLLFGGILVLYAYSLTSQLFRTRKYLERTSNIDMLTGLLNRRGLYQKAETLFSELDERHRSMAVLFADLDRFKAINDALGHDVGDRVLKEVGKVMAASVRGSDVVGRFGGDEFVFILPGTALERAQDIARRVQQAFTDWAHEAKLDLSVSIGIGVAPHHSEDFEDLLAQVDKAMYQSKAERIGGAVACVESGLPRDTAGWRSARDPSRHEA